MHWKDILLLPEVQALLQRARDAQTAAEFAAVDRDIETWVAEHADLYPKPRQRAATRV